MALKKFPMGQAPVVAVSPSPVPAPPQNPNPQIDLQAIKGVFGGRLANAPNMDAAVKKLNDAAFFLAGNTLQIQTNLSATMLRMLFNDEAMHLMESALVERGVGNIRIKLLPAPTPAASGGSASGLASNLISTPFKRLADSAAKLNKVSDQLTTQVEQIDAALKRLNLGVTAWVTISENEDEDGNWSQEQLGYVRIGNRWGVALRSRFAVRGDPGEPDETFSAFADAPRQLRIRAVEHIPNLLDQLSTEAEAMIAKLSPKLEQISELTFALQVADATPEVKK